MSQISKLRILNDKEYAAFVEEQGSRINFVEIDFAGTKIFGAVNRNDRRPDKGHETLVQKTHFENEINNPDNKPKPTEELKKSWLCRTFCK